MMQAELQALEMFRSDVEEIELRGIELDETHARLDAALNTMPHGLIMVDADLRVVLCNTRLRTLFGFDPDVVRPGTPIEQVVAHSVALGNHPGRTVEQICQSMYNRAAQGGRSSFEQLLPDGRLLAVHWEPMQEGGWVCTYEDITVCVAATERAAHLARHDTVTGLPNRAALSEAMLAAWQQRSHAGFNLLCLEIERFQDICDTRGHSAGDELLRHIAQRLGTCVRHTDVVAHLRGAAFAVLQLAPADPEIALRLAHRVVDAVQAPLRINGRNVLPSVRVGIATCALDGTDAAPAVAVEEVLRNASLALHRATQDGGERVLLYAPDMDSRAQARHALEMDLRAALAANQFELLYQPLVSVSERRVVGFEALLRWKHPERGCVPPVLFIPLAEELGLIEAIGAWVLRTACTEAAGWPAPVRVAVNLSPLQFSHGPGPGLAETVAEALVLSGLPGARLELEITESVRLLDDAATLETLHRMRRLGARIALDDFGTGYSSLSYLRAFPFDKLKIDQSFVRGLPEAESVAIVRAISALGASLGISTVAEGVETQTQLAALVAEGCDVMQGYLFSKPLPAAEVPGLIETAPDKLTS
jgi:diguanylate cyclase (GGDEF)-like protein